MQISADIRRLADKRRRADHFVIARNPVMARERFYHPPYCIANAHMDSFAQRLYPGANNESKTTSVIFLGANTGRAWDENLRSYMSKRYILERGALEDGRAQNSLCFAAIAFPRFSLRVLA